MAGDEPDKNQEQFTEAQLQAEIVKQELQEAENQLRLRLGPLLAQHHQFRGEWKKTGFGLSKPPPEGYEGMFEDSLTLMEQYRQLQLQKAQLKVFHMRGKWSRANMPERALLMRQWAPYWLRRNALQKPLFSVGLWAMRNCLKIYRKLYR